MPKRWVVELADEERASVLAMTQKGRAAVRRVRRAHVLLQADAGQRDVDIATALHIDGRTVERIRRRFVERGLAGALADAPRPGAARRMDGRQEAHLVAIACRASPAGRSSWTMQLLADRLVGVGIVPTISDETVRLTLKKGASNRG
jgi:transposase